jgi:hypothetical protein
VTYCISVQGGGFIYLAPSLAAARGLAASIRREGQVPLIRNVDTGTVVLESPPAPTTAKSALRPARQSRAS